MASSEPLDTAVPVAEQFPDFSFVLANECPLMLNPLEMD